ncbi:winged helix-turn-helix transcriptional regulator [Amycolatopsis sp. NPDC059021]|uniref:winged helix-turn-helix transcriptional regulator n=1 Tax=Amycolatopsis sp. NPDC059021 TaxID=3346704 RepID=UPI00366F0523
MTDGEGVPYRQSLHEALEILNGKWTIAVLSTLVLGEKRYRDLQNEVNEAEARLGWTSHSKPLSDRVLANTLQHLQLHGLIERRAEEGGNFAGVWYQLTSEGRALLHALHPLATWAQRHREIMAELKSQ